MSNKYEPDVTIYGEKVEGDAGNYSWPVRFDKTRPENYVQEPAYIGITQFDEHGKVKDRVLLSPDQTEELLTFVRAFHRNPQ